MQGKGIIKQLASRRSTRHGGCLFLATCLALFFIVRPLPAKAGGEPSYDEISVFVSVPRVGGTELPAVFSQEALYLPITDLFTFLKIQNTLSGGLDSVSGYFIDPKAVYLIDFKEKRIQYKTIVFDSLQQALLRTETNLYLRSDYFGKVFGLECTFKLRSLSVVLSTQLELPVIREMRQELLRRNLKKIKGDVQVDTTMGREYRFFNLGTADWSITNAKTVHENADTKLNLRVGGVLAGGELSGTLQYDNRGPTSLKQQGLQWRFVDNTHRMVKQVTIGTILPNATVSLFAPVIGVQLTNTATQQRRSFGTYTLSDRTEPDWTVELYINAVLVDYVKADASGFFTFEVPLMYGNTAVKLRFYGPSGEERFSERTIPIPFNFLPAKELEYTFSAGVVEEAPVSKFARAVIHYGVNQRLTVGGGMEYLSSVVSGRYMPFATATLRLTPYMLLSAEYMYGVQLKSTLGYRRPSNLQLELNYTRYTKGQKAILNSNLEERKATVSLPLLRTKYAYWLSRFMVNQSLAPVVDYETLLHTKYIEIPKRRLLTTELTLSGSLGRLNTSLTTYGVFRKATDPYSYSNLAVAYPLAPGLSLRPQLQVDYTQAKRVSLKLELEKRVRDKAVVTAAYQRSHYTRMNSYTLGFHYNFSFAKMGVSMTRDARKTAVTESASGSLIYDKKTQYARFGNRSGIGRCGMALVCFLDLNGNGRWERNEPPVPGLKFRINGRRVVPDTGEGVVRVLDLEPYTDYLLELDANSFSNIAWQLPKKVLRVTVAPNSIRRVAIPVRVMGEASGMVYLQTAMAQKGLSRVLINFYDSSAVLVAHTLTESDGYFSYLGLIPGTYTARVDSAQLRMLNLRCTSGAITFTIAGSEEGTIADGFEFRLQSVSDTAKERADELQRQPSAAPVPESGYLENRKTAFHQHSGIATDQSIQPNPENKKLAGRNVNAPPALPETPADRIDKDAVQAGRKPKIDLSTKNVVPVVTRQPPAIPGEKQGAVADTGLRQAGGHAQGAIENERMRAAAQIKRPASAGKNISTTKRRPANGREQKNGKQPDQPAGSRRQPPPTIPKTKSAAVARRSGSFVVRQQLAGKMQRLDQRAQKAYNEVQRLRKEQQRLLQEQKKLLNEIKFLRLQLQNSK